MNKLIFLCLVHIVLLSLSSQLEVSKIKIGTTNTKISLGKSDNKIKIYQINTNYHSLNISINTISNINLIQLTDVKTDSNINQCDKKSNLCQIRSTTSSSQINFINSICVNSLYLLIQKENPNEDSSFIISVTFSTENKSCHSLIETSFSYCGQSTLEDCRQCRRQSCSILQCGSKTGNSFTPLYELCVPYSISNEAKKEKCLSFNNVNTFQSSGQCEYDDLAGYSTFTVIVITVVVIVILVFSGAVIYYNVYVRE